MYRALFIVFEGIDGSGTTTQSHLLADKIEALGHPVIRTREPGGTPLAEKIRDLVLDPEWENMFFTTELFLYAASRTQHVQERIRPALKADKPVVCDRFTGSTLAYQGYGRNLDLEMIRQVNHLAIGGCIPDMTIYLDLPMEEAGRRRRKRAKQADRLEGAGDALQERVAQGYRQIAAQHTDTSLLVEATLKPADLAERIYAKLKCRWPQFPFKN